MIYKAKEAVPTKHLIQIEYHVEFENVKPGGK
jgi:hypothetical protein